MNVTYSNFTDIQQLKLNTVKEVGRLCVTDPSNPMIPIMFKQIQKLEADISGFCKYLAKGKERKNG